MNNMENQVEKFDPSTLMEGVKDRIKATFISLIPEEQWAQMIQKEVDLFFKEEKKQRYNNNELWSSRFSDLVQKELMDESRKRMVEYLSSAEFEIVWNNNGISTCSEAVKKMLIDNSGEILMNSFGSMFSCMLSSFRNFLTNENRY